MTLTNKIDDVICFHMTPEQCRAARGKVDWSQSDLAREAGVSISTVRDFEAGRRKPIQNNMQSMEKSFTDSGIRFFNNSETRLQGIEWTDSQKSA